MTKKRRRCVHLHVMVTPEEQTLIADRMAEAGITNMGAYMRKMALNGYAVLCSFLLVLRAFSIARVKSNAPMKL